MRLAWFTPWPPQRSGIAGRSAELVPLLSAGGHGIDVFVDERAVPLASARPVADSSDPAAGSVRVQSAHDFVWRAARGQYDLVVYQVGNSRVHEFIWPYLFRWPGLAVLHEARLHHARGRARLSARRADDYRAEFAWNHPDVNPEAAELAVAGFDGPYYYLWPMVRRVVATSRAIAVHSRGALADLREAHPDRLVDYVALGEGTTDLVSAEVKQAARTALGLPPEAVVFGVFGALTAEKRVLEILGAFRSVWTRQPDARLLLAGTIDAGVDVRSAAASLGIDRAVTYLDRLDDAAFDRAIAGVDVSLNLRWPTALETSGPWLRALSAGRPTVIIELAHQADVPALDPRTWRPWQPDDSADPVTIAIDILDEAHSLGLAMRRLAVDAALRSRLGSAARAYWEREHSVARMVADYEVLLHRAAAAPAPDPTGPDSSATHPTAYAESLIASFGDLSCRLF